LAYDDIPENQMGQNEVNKLIERIKKEKILADFKLKFQHNQLHKKGVHKY